MEEVAGCLRGTEADPGIKVPKPKSMVVTETRTPRRTKARSGPWREKEGRSKAWALPGTGVVAKS